MMYVQYITPLILAPIVLADYNIDNANTSVVYSMAPSQSGLAWQTFSVGSQSLALGISNSTGNYTIPLDASHCYDENYALGVCGINDNCFVQIPFTGSGITMYVFNAGLSGMTASFAIDGGKAVSNSIDAPPPPTYQVSNVSLYSIQGLTTGNHTMVMTILDWNGSPTSMKFDYAYVNETFVAAPATTSLTSMTSTTSQVSSQTPSQTSAGNPSTSNKINTGAVIGGTLGGVIVLATLVIGLCYLRKRKAQRQDVFSPESTFQVNPFTSEHLSSPTPLSPPYPPQRTFFTQHPEPANASVVPPLTRSAILRDALATGIYPPSEPIQSSQSIRSGMSSAVFQPFLGDSPSVDTDPHSASRLADAGSPFSDPGSRYNLTAEQIAVIDRLRADNVPAETIARVIEGLVTSRLSAGESGSGKVMRDGSIMSALPPPSYQTRDR